MRAVLCTAYGGPDVLKVTDIDKPVPNANEVLIRVYATTVTVADVRVRSFTVPAIFWIPGRLMLGIWRPKKSILGAEIAGVVEAIGKSVTKFKIGDQILAACLPSFGGYAEYNCLHEDGVIACKPKFISFAEAAAIPVGARTALHFLRLSQLKPNQNILIYGASGSVGTYAIQLAKYFGAAVTAVCRQQNFELVKSLGADEILDYTDAEFINKLGQYDVIFVAVDKLQFSVCNKHLRQNGVYVNITSPVKNFSMIWAGLTTAKTIIMAHNPPASADDLTFLTRLVEDGKLTVVVDRCYFLNQVTTAHRYVEGGHKKGNVVIKVIDSKL